MGLDMYLMRAPGAYDMAFKAESLFDYEEYLADPDKRLTPDGKPYSFAKWIGFPKPRLTKAQETFYRPLYINRYYAWDVDHRFPRKHIIESVGYWRKANHIHNWFVKNVQNGVDDCKPYNVTEAKLRDLLCACRTVLNKAKLEPAMVQNGSSYQNGQWQPIMEEGQLVANPEVCAQLLPTTEGFFFGGTEYDNWYIEDVKNTIEIISKVLKETDFTKETITYQSSW